MRALRRWLATEGRRDGGSTLPLVLVYGLVGLVLVLVVVAATSLYLDRKRLFTLADGAALAAAESWSIDSVRIDDGAFGFDLDPARVHAAAADYLEIAPTDLHDLELVRATSVDGVTVSVTLRARWVAPVSTDLIPVELPIEVTATARSVFH
ncbi:pilus assembly protein TadG-related protein [Agromyces larvae]|uniref:Pilus assembly protein TadG-related protein n=1 Tax=Agromyces larvae TaxID=2929802 RepID=A0ABY4CA21_9MICO|nr:pilus assembly protein TadG-related protein [Agromyces larvae]UOE45535.1 pilus assembly protein TadG-related protein [Agromyces larvae]